MSEDAAIRASVAEWRRKSREQRGENGSPKSRARRFFSTVLLAFLGCVAAYVIARYWPRRPADVDFGSGACFVVLLGIYVLTRNQRIVATTFAACLGDSIWWVANPPTDPLDWLWLAHFTALGIAELALLQLWETRAIDPLSLSRQPVARRATSAPVLGGGRRRLRRRIDRLRSRFPGAR